LVWFAPTSLSNSVRMNTNNLLGLHSYGLAGGYSEDLAKEVISEIRTDLDAFSDAEAAVLENDGYLLADAAMRKHAVGFIPDPVPGLNIPHPEWMDEDRVKDALRESAKRRLLGRN
jgi:NTE family protein